MMNSRLNLLLLWISSFLFLDPTLYISLATAHTSRAIGHFDKDDRENCHQVLEYCQSDIYAHVFIQCSISCVRYLQDESGMVGTADDPEDFYSHQIRNISRAVIDTDRFEGYVTVVAFIPLLPGMAAYYYNMMEHLHVVFRPTVQFVAIPMDLGLDLHIRLRAPRPNVLVFEEETAPELHPLIQFLTKVKPRNGAGVKDHHGEMHQSHLQTDRVTIYIVSADAYFVERMTSPTMGELEQKIGVYMKTIDYEL
jgi:hypothetical protein